MPTVEITSNQLYLNVPMHLYGNVGMGTDDPMYPLHVTAPKVTTASLSNISYENFTLDLAYTNRIPLSVVGNTDDGAALIPDFGFNFFINNVNYRQSTYVGTNGYVTFGEQFTLYDQPMPSFTVPTLFVGYTNIVVNQVSYSISSYAGAPAVYIFFDGYDITAPSRLNEWCVVLQSNGNMRIWMKTIHNDSQCLFGLSDGKGNWLVQLPENNSTPDPGIVNTGYLLAMVHTPVGVGMGVKGDIIANGDMLVTGAVQASSIGLSSLLQYPPLAMKSNTVGMTHALYGNGTYTALSSYPDGFVNDPYHLFEREETSEFLQWGYDATTSLYFGTTSTNFTDANSTPTSLAGEWVQLKFPSAVTLTSYGIKPVAAYLTSAPRLYAVLGSSDGFTWYLIDDHRTSAVSYVDASEKIMVVTPALSHDTAYSYYRFVTNAISTGGTDPHVRMQQLNFYIKNQVVLQGDTTANGNLIVLGNVGIGTSSPSATLEIIGTIKATQFIGDGSMLTGTSGGGGGGEPSGWTSNVEYVYTTNATNVGIGTTTPNASLHVVGDMLVQGTILPATCNTYDLGSSNYRFRDLYLSGNTINIEGTRISKDQTTGGISITNDFNQLLNAQVNSLYASGNIGIGTTVALYPLHVKSIIAPTSFTSVTYEDYTLWDAYDPSKRTTFPLSVNEDEESFLLPDIGFDFIYNGVNYRDSLWVCTNSYITFGTQFTEYNPEPGVEGLFENIPTLFVGADDSITNFISYYKGTYNGRKAMFVFFDAKDYGSGTLFQKWCVVIQSDKIWVFMNLIETYPNSEFGLWNGSEWDVQFPENLIGTNISTTAYVIHLKKENNAILFDGNVSTKGNTIIDGSTQLLNSTKRTGLYKSYASKEYDDYTTWSAYQNKVSVISNNDKVSAILPDFGFDFYISDKNFRKQCFVNVNSFISFGGPMQTYYYLNNSGYKALFIGPVDVGGIQIFANDISYSIGTYNDANAVYVFYDGIASTNNFYKWCVIFDEKNQIHVFLKEIYSTEPNCVFGIGLGTGIYDWYMQLPHCYTIPSLNNIAYSITIDTVPYGEALHVEGTGFFAGNIGIGTTSAYPLQIAQSLGGEYTSYINTVFEDYTLWAEYTNRRNLFVFPDTNDGFTLIPDFGFDFYIGSKNIRLQSFAITNSYITFGGSTTAWTNANNLGLVGLHLGSAGTGVEFISYSYGVYNSKQSIFVFFDGYDYYDYYNKKIQWCVIFSSDNSISILIKKLHMGQNASIGLGTGNGTWNVQLPGHNTTPDPAIVDTAYRLIFNIKPYGNALFVQGNIICNDNIGIGTTSPTAKLDVVGTVKATQFIGDGSLLTGLTSGWTSNATSIYNTSQNLGIGTTNPNVKLHVYGTSIIGKGVESRYPPSALNANTSVISTANYGTGSYVASASHTTFGDQPFYLFDFNDANTFHQGEARYSGGYTFNSPATSTDFLDYSSTQQTILGEWVQIRLPEAIKLNRYIIKPRDGFLNRSPRAFVLLGSSDESSWYLIDDHRTNVVTYDDATEKVLTPTQPQTVAYNYYRLVTNAVNGGEQYVNFNELKLYAKNDQPMLTVDGDAHIHGNIGLGLSSTMSPLVNIYHDGTSCVVHGVQYNMIGSGSYQVEDTTYNGLPGTLLTPSGSFYTIPGFATFNATLFSLLQNSTHFKVNGSRLVKLKEYRTNLTSGFGKYVFVYEGPVVAITPYSQNTFEFYNEVNKNIFAASISEYSSSVASTKFIVKSDGNVGIGTTQPTTLLDVVGTVKATQFIGDGSLLSGISAGWTSNATSLYNTSQNIGIGTTDPNVKLQVIGTVSATSFSGSGALLTSLDVGNVSAGTLTVARGGIGTSTLAVNKLLVGNGTSSLIQPTNLHWDNTNSRLGVGTITPSSTLHVSGNSRLEGDLVVTNNITANTMISSNLYVIGDVVTMNTLSSNTEQMVITNAGTGPALKVVQTGLMSIHTVAEFVDAETGTALIINNGGNIGIGTTIALAKTHIYHTGGGNILRIDDETAPDASPFIINQDGNVGIGTTNPIDKLQVNGGVIAGTLSTSGSYFISCYNPLYGTSQTIGLSPSLTLDFSYPVLIQYYTLQGNANSGFWDRQPIDFTIQASLDNITYTVIDTRTSVNWAITNPQTFTISPAVTNYYRYYRMVPTAIGDNSKNITYPEWYIYAVPTSLFPSSVNVFGSIATRGNAHIERYITLGSNANILWRSDTSSQFMLQAKNGLTWKKSSVIYPSQNVTTIVRLRTGTDVIMYENRTTHEFIGNPNFDSVTYGILKEVQTNLTLFHKYNNIWIGDAWGDTTVGVVFEPQPDGGFRIRTGFNNSYIGYDETQDIIKQYSIGNPNILTWYKVPVSGASIGYTGNSLQLASSNEAITFVQNTTEAMRIATNGNIGIGTTTPNVKLQVIGTVSATAFSGSGALLTSLDVGNVSSGTLTVARGGIGTSTLAVNKLLVGNGTSSLLQPTNLHWDNTNSRLGIGSTQPSQVFDVSGNGVFSGNVGIGTINPTVKLQVIGTVSATSFSGSGALLTSLDVGNVSAGTLTVTRGGIGTSTLAVNKLLVGNGTSSLLQPTNLHWDNTNSRLGIGSTQPSQVFDVSGNGVFSGNVGIGTTNPTAKTHIYHTGGGDILRIDDETVPDASPFIINQDGNIGIGTTTPLQKMDVNGNALFSGSVGIGTTTPLQKMDVNGNALFSGSVGIGITNPIKKMHISGTNNGAVLVQSSNVPVQMIPNAYYQATADTILPSQISFNRLTQWGGFTPTIQGPLYQASGGYKNQSAYASFDRTLSNVMSRTNFEFSLTSGTGFTLSMLCKFVGTPSSRETIFDLGNQNQHELTFYRNESSGNFNLLHRTNYVSTVFTNVLSISQNNWGYYILHGTYGYANNSSNVTLNSYLNGRLISSTTSDVNSKMLGSQAVSFGGSRIGAGTGVSGKTQFNGDIAAFYFYDYSLSDAQLSSLMNYYNLGTSAAPVRVENNVLSPAIQIATFEGNDCVMQFDTTQSMDYATMNYSCNVGLSVNTNGLNALTINLGGNIGIGTTVVLAKTHIYHTGVGDILRVDDETAPDASPFLIKQDGNIGVGTIDPNVKLQVIGTVSATSFSGSGALLTSLDVGNVSAGTLGVARGGIGTATLSTNKLLVGNGTSALLQPTNLHWDNTNSRLGIGSTQPMQVLDVSGNGVFSGNLGIGTVTPLTKLHIYYTGSGDILRIDDELVPDSTPFVINRDGNVGIGTNTPLAKTHICYGGAGDVFRIDDQNAPDISPFIINEEGNIGIGTIIPTTNLYVVGTSTFTNGLFTRTISATPSNVIYEGQLQQLTSNISYSVSNWNGFTPVNVSSPPTYYTSGGYKNEPTLKFVSTTNSTLMKSETKFYGIRPGFTFGLQCKLTGTPTAYETLFDFGNENLDEITLYRDNTTSSFNLFHRGYYQTTPTFTNIFTNPISQNSWVNIVLRGTYGYSGSSSNLTLDTYVNGVLASSKLEQIVYPITQSTKFAIGGKRSPAGTSIDVPKDNMTGDIAAFHFYSFPLTDAQVQDLSANYIAGTYIRSIFWTTTSEMKSRIISLTSNEPPLIRYDDLSSTYAASGLSNNSYFIEVDGVQMLTVRSEGNVGIGSLTPTTKLDVDGVVKATSFNGSSAFLTSLYTEGNVGIGTTNPVTQLTVNGTIRNINGPAPTSGTSLVITGDGDIAPQSSDARYKTNVEDLPSVLDAMMNMRAVSYHWKDEPQKWYGLLAQQVSEVFPDAAWHNTENDTYGVHYTPTVVTLLLKAMQEMKQTYDQRISNLETELENIRRVLPH